MKQLFEEFRGKIDAESIMKHTEELWKLELGQTVSCWHASAQRTLEILQETGIPNARKITFPADGKTAFQDKITPLAWDASIGKLTILSGSGIRPGFVAADYKVHPFHLIKGSCATAPGGEKVRILTREQVLAGEDPHDAMVMLAPGKMPDSKAIRFLLDLGVRGIVSDWAMNAEDAPDGIQWCNAFTEGANWHAVAADRPFLAFCVTPHTGRMLRTAAARGEVEAKIECDGRRFESTVDVVTAMVPGRRKEEFWIIAHLYEPLSNDNSSGVSAAIETARLLMKRGTPEYSLRLIFGLEHYGFAQYASTRGKNLSGEVIGACDYDAMYLHKGWSINFNCASPALPFCGNYLFRMLSEDLKQEPGTPQTVFRNSFECMYDDDSFLGDSTTGIPVVWPIRTGKNFWHNSSQRMSYVEKDEFALGTAIHTAFVCAIVNPEKRLLARILPSALEQLGDELKFAVGSAKEHLAHRYEILAHDMADFKRDFPSGLIDPMLSELQKKYLELSKNLPDEVPHSVWRDYAEQIVPSRLRTGLPYDLADVPYSERRELPGRVLYSPLAAVLSDMDGKRTLAEVIRTVEHEIRRLLKESELRAMVHAVLYLARYGYVSLGTFRGVSQADLVRTLREAGVKKGDFLLVHSAFSAFGLIDGGAETVFRALREAVGENGTFLMPAFTFPFVFIGGPNRLELYRPFDPKDLNQIWTGTLPRILLSTHPEAVRSRHITHSWCGLGPLAAEAVAAHQPYDPPAGPSSPLAFALKHRARIVELGSPITETTFLHYIEDHCRLPGLQTVLCVVRRPNGSCEYHAVERNLPGDRDFNRGTAETIEFFREAVKRGLEIRQVKLGPGTVTVMETEKLFRIGVEIAKENPLIMLCGKEKQCLSCNRMKYSWED